MDNCNNNCSETEIKINKNIIENLPKIEDAPVRNVSIHSHHSSNLSHASIHHFHTHSSMKKILEMKVDLPDEGNLNDFCSYNIESKFRLAIKSNFAKPTESDTKTFNFRIYHNTSIEKIIASINKYNDVPKSIIQFIISNIELLLTDQIDGIKRQHVCLYEESFHKVSITSKKNSVTFGKNYYKISIILNTVKYE